MMLNYIFMSENALYAPFPPYSVNQHNSIFSRSLLSQATIFSVVLLLTLKISFFTLFLSTTDREYYGNDFSMKRAPPGIKKTDLRRSVIGDGSEIRISGTQDKSRRKRIKLQVKHFSNSWAKLEIIKNVIFVSPTHGWNFSLDGVRWGRKFLGTTKYLQAKSKCVSSPERKLIKIFRRRPHRGICFGFYWKIIFNCLIELLFARLFSHFLTLN